MIQFASTYVALFGVRVHYYALCVVGGMALAIALACAREEKLGLPKDTATDLTLWCVPAAIIGARLYYVLFSLPEYTSGTWTRVFAVWEGGLAFYGGVIGGIIAGLLYAKRKKLSLALLLDLVAPCFPLGQAIGRWGNFINGECYGAPVENAALRFFPMAVNIHGVWHYAAFFYESVWCMLIVVMLLCAERKRFFRERGDAFLAYLLLYAAERACVEGLRTDSLYLGSLRVSQALSLLAAMLVTLTFALRGGRKNRLTLCASLLFASGLIFAATDLGWGVFTCCAAGLCAAAAGQIGNKQAENAGGTKP